MMQEVKEETAIQVRVRPVPAVMDAAEPISIVWPGVYPDLMTEEEVIVYLRIPHVSLSTNFKHVIDHLIRMRDLPCIHVCRKRLYPLAAVKQWILAQIGKGAA